MCCIANKKLRTLCGTHRIINNLIYHLLPCLQEPTTGPHLELYESCLCPLTGLRTILVSWSHVLLHVPAGHFHLGVPSKTLKAFLSSFACYMSCPSWFAHPTDIFWWMNIMKVLIMQFSLVSCYILPLPFKYYAIYYVLKHTECTVHVKYEIEFITYL